MDSLFRPELIPHRASPMGKLLVEEGRAAPEGPVIFLRQTGPGLLGGLQIPAELPNLPGSASNQGKHRLTCCRGVADGPDVELQIHHPTLQVVDGPEMGLRLPVVGKDRSRLPVRGIEPAKERGVLPLLSGQQDGQPLLPVPQGLGFHFALRRGSLQNGRRRSGDRRFLAGVRSLLGSCRPGLLRRRHRNFRLGLGGLFIGDQGASQGVARLHSGGGLPGLHFGDYLAFLEAALLPPLLPQGRQLLPQQGNGLGGPQGGGPEAGIDASRLGGGAAQQGVQALPTLQLGPQLSQPVQPVLGLIISLVAGFRVADQALQSIRQLQQLLAQGAFPLGLQLLGHRRQTLLQDLQFRAEAGGAKLRLREIAFLFCHNLSSFLSDSGHSL